MTNQTSKSYGQIVPQFQNQPAPNQDLAVVETEEQDTQNASQSEDIVTEKASSSHVEDTEGPVP